MGRTDHYCLIYLFHARLWYAKSSDFHVSACKSQLSWSETRRRAAVARDAGVWTEDVIITVVMLNWTTVLAPGRRTSSSPTLEQMFWTTRIWSLLSSLCSDSSWCCVIAAVSTTRLYKVNHHSGHLSLLCLKPKQTRSFGIQETIWMNEQWANYIC